MVDKMESKETNPREQSPEQRLREAQQNLERIESQIKPFTRKVRIVKPSSAGKWQSSCGLTR
jgi:hypothetical protein